MACAHVRRCPNWQCWWDEDSVVAASGLTEDDERNLQADKMRSKARARKLAKSRCSLFRFLPLFSRRAPKLLRLLYMSTRVLVICHILKRGGGDSFCPELTFLLKMLSRLRLAPRPLPPARCGLGSGAFPASQSFHVWWEKRRWCFDLIALLGCNGRDKHWRPQKEKKNVIM